MIIRKPYAFLIKYFRFINFFILIFSSYILYKTSLVLNFFNKYVETRQFIESDTLINDTIPLNIIVFCILLIILCGAIAILFKKKDKPTLFYFWAVIYYVILIVICLITRRIMNVIIFEGLDPRISRIVRDVWLIAVIVQVSVIFFSLIRTLGFDVKKFNFGEDLHELKISDEDNEEVELATRFNSDKFKMKAAMQREELKAFFYENKLIIIFIIILLLVVMPATLIARNIIANKRYAIGEVIDLNKFNLMITDAFVTKKDYKGNSLFQGNNSYLIIKFNINNLVEKERGITLNNLRLEVNDKVYMPKTNYYDSFIDIGNGYNNNKIVKESKDYIVVYVINDEDLEHEMIIRYADVLKIKNSKVDALYYRTIIEPRNIDKNVNVVNLNMGDNLVIDTNEFAGVTFDILKYELSDNFTYELNGDKKYIINSTGYVLSLNYKFISDNMSFIDFINDYAMIQYKYNNIVYLQSIKQITSSKDSSISYFAVSENLKDAAEISLVINLRNTKYVYKIK